MLAVGTIAMGFVSEPLSSWLPMPDAIKEVFDKILNNTAWAFVTTVVAAPIVEEFILRGVIEKLKKMTDEGLYPSPLFQ